MFCQFDNLVLINFCGYLITQNSKNRIRQASFSHFWQKIVLIFAFFFVPNKYLCHSANNAHALKRQLYAYAANDSTLIYLPRNAWVKLWAFLKGGLTAETLAPPASNSRLNPGWRDLSTHRNTTQPLNAPQEYPTGPDTESDWKVRENIAQGH